MPKILASEQPNLAKNYQPDPIEHRSAYVRAGKNKESSAAERITAETHEIPAKQAEYMEKVGPVQEIQKELEEIAIPQKIEAAVKWETAPLAPEEEERFLAVLQANVRIIKEESKFISGRSSDAAEKNRIKQDKERLINFVLSEKNRLQQGYAQDSDSSRDRGDTALARRRHVRKEIPVQKSWWSKVTDFFGVSKGREADKAIDPLENFKIETFTFIPPRARRNKDFIIKGLQKIPGFYELLDPDMQKDPEIMQALENKGKPAGRAFEEPTAKNNSINGKAEAGAVSEKSSEAEIGNAAKSSREILRNIRVEELTDAQKSDPELMKMLIAKNARAVIYAAEQLQQSREFVLEAVEKNGMAAAWIKPEFASDKQIALTAVKSKGQALKALPPVFRGDEEVVKEAVKSSGASAFKYASETLRNDPDFVLSLVGSNPNIISLATPRLKNDWDFNLQAARINHECIRYMAKDFKEEMVSLH